MTEHADRPWLERTSLAGRLVLLIGGGTSGDDGSLMSWDDETVDDEWLAIDEAVAGLARAVLAEGGRLLVHEDSEFAAYAAQVALEYQGDRLLESREASPAPVEFWRSGDEGAAGDRREGSDAPDALGRLADLGALAVRTRVGHSQLDDSLGSLPLQAIVCVGGSYALGSRIEALARNLPLGHLFALPSTGGLASDLKHVGNLPVRQPEIEWLPGWLELVQNEYRDLESEDPVRDPRRAWPVPYPLICQRIVEEILDREDPPRAIRATAR